MSCGMTLFTSFVVDLWCQPSTLLLTWIAFFAFAFWWLRGQRRHVEVDGAMSNTEKMIHFRDLPSPRGFPILGNVTQLGDKPHLVLTKWAKTYGKLYRIKMGFNDVLVVNGLQAIKRANLKQYGDFAGRPPYETSKLICGGDSLTFETYSHEWSKRKRCTKQALLLYTTGRDPNKRNVMEETTNQLANELIDQLVDKCCSEEDGSVDPDQFAMVSALNSLSQLCFGKMFTWNDPKLRTFLTINQNFDEAMGAAQAVNIWPILKHVPVLGRPFQNLKSYSDSFWDYVTSFLDDHLDTYDPNNLRDIVDCLKFSADKLSTKYHGDVNANGSAAPPTNDLEYDTNENGASEQNGCNGVNAFDAAMNGSSGPREDSYGPKLTQRRICADAGDVFGAGYDTLYTAISWSLFYMAAYPDVQQKLREEVESVIPADEEPSFRLHNKRSCYIQAFIYEMFRHVAIIPLLLPHSTVRDTELENCIIPRGVTVFFNVHETTRDPDLWENPEEFNPERFLHEDETGMQQLNKNKVSQVVSWGFGPRRCPGMDLSRHQLFIYIASIVRRCYVEQSKPGVEPAFPWPTNFGLTSKAELFKGEQQQAAS